MKIPLTAIVASSLLGIVASSSAADATGANPGLHYYYPVPKANPAQKIDVDICVYGGTPGGVAAAVQASRMGKKVAFVVFRRHVGGMTSGGLTATDVGNQGAIGGMAREFYDRIGRLSGFKPSEAEAVFRSLLAEANVPIYFETRLASVQKTGSQLVALVAENGNSFHAKEFIDATYEGDLLAKAGVSYHVGREGNAKYGETINGVQFKNQHNFTVPVDPYKTPGDPKSGLLWGISAEDPGKAGQGDKKIQAYNFRMFLTNAENRLPWPKPAGYDPTWFALYARYTTLKPQLPFPLHNGDCNNNGGFSTDNIGRNYAWPEADYATREKIFQDHVTYQQGLAYFAAHDESVPAEIRTRMATYGPNPGEFPETGGWPHELYVREGRRMVSDYVMTEHNCLSETVAEKPVGLAAYTMDSHNCQRVVIDGRVRNEGDVQTHTPAPYSIAYASIVPKQSECVNLFVPVCLSSSHIAYGSIRMEPVFMILGQSAGTAAAMAIDASVDVQQVDYAKLQERLVADKQILVWTGKPAKAGPPVKPVPEIKGGIVVDDEQAQKVGEWKESTSTRPYIGEGYLTDNNEEKGKKSIRYSPELPAAGKYDLFIHYTPLANRASNVPVDVVTTPGAKPTTVTVNEREPAGENGWRKIYTGQFPVKGSTVTIRNDGTDGHVIADGVCLAPAGS